MTVPQTGTAPATPPTVKLEDWTELVDVRGVLERECEFDIELVSESVVLAVDHRKDEEAVMGSFFCHESGDFLLSEFRIL